MLCHRILNGIGLFLNDQIDRKLLSSVASDKNINFHTTEFASILFIAIPSYFCFPFVILQASSISGFTHSGKLWEN